MEQRRKEYAVYVITKHGLEIAKKLKEILGDVDLYISPKFLDKAPEGSYPLSLPMGPTLKKTFFEYYCHIHIISVGAVVRMIAPLMKNKKIDPAIVCVDDKANFSVCLLSGHVGRGNIFTKNVAEALNNTPVITTASDVSGTLTVDILGRELGWKLENVDRNVTKGCAAVVNQERVLFVQECGEPNWWPVNKKLPPGVSYGTSLDGINHNNYEMLLVASDRSNISETHPDHFEKSVIYNPKTLILGLGCDKETPFEVIEKGVLNLLKEKGLALQSVKEIATIDLKKNEPGFIELSKKYNWEIKSFGAEELDKVEGIENPSEIVKKYVGTKSVGEASALLCSGASKLLLPKQKFSLSSEGKNLTMAVARIPFHIRKERINA
jgi:cobalt-precorrin 5A hydrolase